MEISPVSFTGAANCARRKMMTPTKLKQHAKKITLAKISQTQQAVRQKIDTPLKYMPTTCRALYF